MTTRQRLQRALRDLDRVAQDEAISPTPYTHLLEAIREAQKATAFALGLGVGSHE